MIARIQKHSLTYNNIAQILIKKTSVRILYIFFTVSFDVLNISFNEEDYIIKISGSKVKLKSEISKKRK